ncbi:MAG: LLM class flavin-dependent oxidoreductase [Thaumarchaeota archaeon]|nr:LLM class flavin-dependent oxidoreductase [Nitrososphaerota archaeon]
MTSFYDVPSADDLWAVAEKADDAGFKSLWATEGILRPGTQFDALSVMAGVAARTRYAKIGVGVIVLPLRNPVFLAHAVATMDHLSGGRLILGIGLGAFQNEYEAAGVPFGERGERADEIIEIMRMLWAGSPVTYEGKFFRLKELDLKPKPLQKHVPLWIGGRTEAAFRRAAKYGDGWLDNSPFATPEEFGSRTMRIEELSKNHGRHPDVVEPGLDLYVNLNRDVNRAQQEAMSYLNNFYGPVYGSRNRSIENVGAFGSRSTIVSKIEEYAGSGAKMVCLCPATDQILKQVDLYVKEILPSF